MMAWGFRLWFRGLKREILMYAQEKEFSSRQLLTLEAVFAEERGRFAFAYNQVKKWKTVDKCAQDITLTSYNFITRYNSSSYKLNHTDQEIVIEIIKRRYARLF